MRRVPHERVRGRVSLNSCITMNSAMAPLYNIVSNWAQRICNYVEEEL